jgi:hypothetical protein
VSLVCKANYTPSSPAYVTESRTARSPLLSISKNLFSRFQAFLQFRSTLVFFEYRAAQELCLFGYDTIRLFLSLVVSTRFSHLLLSPEVTFVCAQGNQAAVGNGHKSSTMKQRFSSLDVKVICHELNATLTSLRVSNIYDLSSVRLPPLRILSRFFCPTIVELLTPSPMY